MNKNVIFIFILCCLGSTLFFSQKQPNKEIIVDFYDINFLRNSPEVEKILKTKGFFEVNFQTQDGLMINAIMLDQSGKHDVTGTIISFPGFVPGKKEGMSTLYAMLQDQPYNFMFIDARGHGKSDGQLLTYQGMQQYGHLEYLDMVGAIDYISAYNEEHNICPHIVIHGLCSGAYHTVRAVNDLKNKNPKNYAFIKGIILDSAWPSIPAIIDTIITAESKERCKNYYVPFLQPYLAYALQKFYDTCLKEHHISQISLTDIITEIDQPIFFIHAQDDDYVPAHHTEKLIKHSKNPQSWFVSNSSHVNNHLEHKDMYKEKLHTFIQSIL